MKGDLIIMNKKLCLFYKNGNIEFIKNNQKLVDKKDIEAVLIPLEDDNTYLAVNYSKIMSKFSKGIIRYSISSNKSYDYTIFNMPELDNPQIEKETKDFIEFYRLLHSIKYIEFRQSKDRNIINIDSFELYIFDKYDNILFESTYTHMLNIVAELPDSYYIFDNIKKLYDSKVIEWSLKYRFGFNLHNDKLRYMQNYDDYKSNSIIALLFLDCDTVYFIDDKIFSLYIGNYYFKGRSLIYSGNEKEITNEIKTGIIKSFDSLLREENDEMLKIETFELSSVRSLYSSENSFYNEYTSTCELIQMIFLYPILYRNIILYHNNRFNISCDIITELCIYLKDPNLDITKHDLIEYVSNKDNLIVLEKLTNDLYIKKNWR